MSLFEDDELTEADLNFLKKWENLGSSDTADAEYQPEDQEFDQGGKGGDDDVVIVSDDSDVEGEVDQLVEGDEPGGEQSEQIDESKMDLSQIEGDDRLSDISDAEDDELDSEDESKGDNGMKPMDTMTEPNHLEGGEAPDEIPEGEDDLEYDGLGDEPTDDQERETFEDENDQRLEDHEDAQAEEEFGDGERANTDSEIEDLDEYERERDEHKGEPEHDSEADDVELDAEEPEPELEDRPEPPSDKEAKSQPSKDHETEGDESHSDQDTSEKPSGRFEELPEPGERCENHCEDNPLDDESEECEHCRARLEKERELWGVVAEDKHGHNLLPGDKVRVVIPMPFTTLSAVLTINVPNLEVDPQRVAQSTAGEIDPDVCWLSGHAISQFTGWHMTEDGSVWTFKKGKKIRFAEKIGEPAFQRHGSNDLDGDQLDTEDMIKKFKDELDELPEQEPESELDNENKEDEDAKEDESDIEDSQHSDSDQGEEDQMEEPEDIEEHRRGSDKLTGTQKGRFENLTSRITKKVIDTFGSTLEGIETFDIVDHGSFVEAEVKIVSRGTAFVVRFAMRRYDKEFDKDCLIDEDDAA